ncbi:MAG: glycerol kinase [Actinomycetia bacterium]|nr:glycerol kinase [Actinomycetes bacterium]
MAVTVLVIDAGTSGVRAAVVREDGSFVTDIAREVLPSSPAGGLVEFDAAEYAAAALDVARAALERSGPVDAVGISNQRASTVVWDRATGVPVGPALGWQDLRTVGSCLVLRGDGLKLAPNQSATKLQWLLDAYDPDRSRDLCFGTIDTWLAWALSDGALHVTDASNAAVTGLQPAIDAQGWDERVLDVLRIDPRMLPTIVDTACVVGEARALPGVPPIASMTGDQQASLAGMACVHRGDAKITFGTGGMLDLTLGPTRPAFEHRGEAGTFPIVAWRVGNALTWGVEAIMLAAGTNVQWLRDDLGIIASADESHEVAARCADTGGVVFVPAPLGLGTPAWDYGARAALFGLTRGSGRPEIVRAVLEGIAHRGADLVESAEADAGLRIPVLRVDGGMTDNPTFIQALADATQRPVEISPVREATTLGAALLAALALGAYEGVEDFARTWTPRARVEPGAPLDRDRWHDAVARSLQWIPELSGIDFA